MTACVCSASDFAVQSGAIRIAMIAAIKQRGQAKWAAGLVLPVAIQDWHARYFTLQLAESYLTTTLSRQILARIERLAWHPI